MYDDEYYPDYPDDPGQSAPAPAEPLHWLYDSSKEPPFPPAPGQKWVWSGTQWTQRAVSASNAGNTNTNTSGPQIGDRRNVGDGRRYFEQWNGYEWVRYDTPGSGRDENSGGGGRMPTLNFSPVPLPQLPSFSFREFQAPEKFSAPTGDQILNEPGYAFRLDQGRRALEQSAAGKGVLRTGGTLKDLIAYGQQFASNEYGNVYNRAKGEYDTDVDNSFRTYGTQYGVARDIFDREYQKARDMYAPSLEEWKVLQNAELQRFLQANNHLFGLVNPGG